MSEWQWYVVVWWEGRGRGPRLIIIKLMGCITFWVCVGGMQEGQGEIRQPSLFMASM